MIATYDRVYEFPCGCRVTFLQAASFRNFHCRPCHQHSNIDGVFQISRQAMNQLNQDRWPDQMPTRNWLPSLLALFILVWIANAFIWLCL